MKNLIAIICLLVSVTACNNKQATTKTAVADSSTAKKTKGMRYTCTMHPQVITTNPGTCPKCGMELVEKDDSK